MRRASTILFVAAVLLVSGCVRELSLHVPEAFRLPETNAGYYQSVAPEIAGAIGSNVVFPETLACAHDCEGALPTCGIHLDELDTIYLGLHRFSSQSLNEIACYSTGSPSVEFPCTYLDRRTGRVYLVGKELAVFDRLGGQIVKDLRTGLKRYILAEGIMHDEFDAEKCELLFPWNDLLVLAYNGGLYVADTRRGMVEKVSSIPEGGVKLVRRSDDRPVGLVRVSSVPSPSFVLIDLDAAAGARAAVLAVPSLELKENEKPPVSTELPRVLAADLSPEGDLLAVDMTILKRTGEGAESVLKLAREVVVHSVSKGELAALRRFAPDQGEIVRLDNNDRLWRIRTGDEGSRLRMEAARSGSSLEERTLEGRLELLSEVYRSRAIAVQPLLLVGSPESGTYTTMNIIDLEKGQYLIPGERVPYWSISAAYSRKHRLLAICEPYSLRVWDLRTGKERLTTLAEADEHYEQVRFDEELTAFVLSVLSGGEAMERDLLIEKIDQPNALSRLLQRRPLIEESPPKMLAGRYLFFDSAGKNTYYQSVDTIVETAAGSSRMVVMRKPGTYNYMYALSRSLFVVTDPEGRQMMVTRKGKVVYEPPVGWSMRSSGEKVYLHDQASGVVYRVDIRNFVAESRPEMECRRFEFDLGGNWYIFRDLSRSRLFVAQWQKGAESGELLRFREILKENR